MSDEIKLGNIVVFKTDNRAFEVIGKYIVPDDRLWRVEAITEDDPPTPDRNRKYRLVAVDCPNVMLDEIPEIYVESYSEKLERELEEQRKEALKMNRNEIKQGDKVRVREDAPKIYTEGWSCDWLHAHSNVRKTEGDSAEIELDCYALVIPTKYLVKVDAEAKEANVKIGSDKWVDKTVWNYKNHKKGVIRRMTDGVAEVFTEDGKLQTWQIEDLVDEYDDPIEKWKCPEPTTPTIKVGDRVEELISRRSGIVLGIEGDIVVVGIPYDKEKQYWHIDSVELVKPTEQTETEKKPNVGSIKIPVEVDLTDSHWDAYAADLAKEVALKVANKKMDNHPEEIGAYAVSVAKAVVEGLKRK